MNLKLTEEQLDIVTVLVNMGYSEQEAIAIAVAYSPSPQDSITDTIVRPDSIDLSGQGPMQFRPQQMPLIK